MYATTCMLACNSQSAVIGAITIGFTGQFKGWWDCDLDGDQRNAIKIAIKRDENNQPILAKEGQAQEDAIYA